MDALQIKDLSKVYPNKLKAVNNVNLSVKKGDFFGLLGPNGAGKTTTIGIITGLVNKSSGSVKVFGKDTIEDATHTKINIGIVPQEINVGIFDIVIHVVVNQAGYYGIPKKVALKKSEKVLKLLGLWEKRNQRVQALSGGMKRRLMIAKALVHDPKLLILDEPTAGVDAELRASTWKFLKQLNKKGVTIILTTHYLEEAEALCKNIAIIDKGSILLETSTKKLVTMVENEVFVLSLEKPIKSFSHKKYPTELKDNTTLEVTIKKEQNINDFFNILDKKKIKVLSMRNKQNRLEQLFLEIVGGNK